jgi:pilus assembly protein FimV
LFGTTGGQQVDTQMGTATQTVAGSAGAPSTMSGPASTEVDPIAEAEVYIAYGREAQAEEILKEALKRQPERQAIRAKLLEIYAGRKEVVAFNTLAKEMHEMTEGQNEEWPKVLTQGLAIDPANPLYSGDGPKSLGGGVAKVAAVAAGGLAGAGMGAAGLISALDQSVRGNNDLSKAAPKSLADEQLSNGLDIDTDVPAMDFDLSINTGNGAGGVSMQPDTTIGRAGVRLSAAGAATDLSQALKGKIDLPSLDLDLKPSAPLAKPEPAALSDLDDFKLDLPALETLKGPVAQPVSAEVTQDLSAIGLDLTPSTLMGGAGGGESARWQEMATKLDLASAYQDIGDKDGARELLDEVIRGGDTAQQQKARAMLSKIN